MLSQFPGSEDQIGVEQWVHTPGIPENAPQVHVGRVHESGSAGEGVRRRHAAPRTWRRRTGRRTSGSTSCGTCRRR